MEKSKRNLAFYEYLGAVQTALDTIPEAAKEDIEDKAGAYFETLEAEGFAYEESWEFPEWNKGEGINEPQEGLAFLCNCTAGFTTKRTAAAFDSFGKAIAEYVKNTEAPEAEEKLSKAVSENQEAVNRGPGESFAVFVPEGKGFKEIK
ncbi:MAG: hypothetical protein K940chlam7_00561 [Chlamydiae bacterium]|nr:hypothetical protein [Chlamydiota bacterium]